MILGDFYQHAFVHDLEQKRCLRTEWLKEALFRVPRHLFIDQYYEDDRRVVLAPDDLTDEQLRVIYSDRGLMIRKPPNYSAASQPSLVLGMLEDLKIEPDMRVLEIGTGSGWNAGLLAFRLGDGQRIYSIDIQPDLVEAAGIHLRAAGFGSVNLRMGDGGYGWPEEAPFDRIIVTVGSPDIPPAWCEQLAHDGILLVPLKTGGIGDPVLRLWKQDGRLEGGFTRWSGFQTLQGAFWSDSEDVLRPPWDPLIDKLLDEEPTKVFLPERMNMDCLFFLHLKGRRFQALVDYERELGWHPTVFDRDTESICVASRWESLMVYGDTCVGEQLLHGQDEWIAMGRPRITDYRIELAHHASVHSGCDGWLDKRAHAALKFSLGSLAELR